MGELGTIAEETNGQPEHAGLYLPSHVKGRIARTERSLRVIALEIELRQAECMEMLRQVRTASSQKAQTLMGKQKNAWGEVANTRAQAAITRLTVRVSNAIAEYTRSYDALLTLGVTPRDALPLQPLSIKQLEGLMSLLKGDRNLGEGTRCMPWFWTVRDLSSDMTTQPQDKPLIDDEEYTDEWFHGRERFRRWREEEHWLWREIASTLFDYYSRSKAWQTLSQSDYTQRTLGYSAYCVRQSDIFLGLLADGFKQCQEPLNASPKLAICSRALAKEYSGASFELENGAPLAHRSQMRPDTPEPDAISVEEMDSRLLETARQNSIRSRMEELVAEELAQLMNTDESDSEEPDP
ncbi:hypothetical protein FRC11_014204, partial [Ceratobasidium sp. 423]